MVVPDDKVDNVGLVILKSGDSVEAGGEIAENKYEMLKNIKIILNELIFEESIV